MSDLEVLASRAAEARTRYERVCAFGLLMTSREMMTTRRAWLDAELERQLAQRAEEEKTS